MTRHTKIVLSLITFVAVMLGAVCRPAAAQDAPRLSSSLAKNLWRQCHMYFEEGMDAKAKRACGELQSWAQENNEPAVAREAADMVAALDARAQPAVAPAPSPRPEKESPLQSTDAACGFGSVDNVPMNLVTKTVTSNADEFVTCRQDRDCVLAKNLCGTTRAVNQQSRACYEALVGIFDRNMGCPAGESLEAAAVCREGRCMMQFN